MAVKPHNRFRDLSDERIRNLVDSLNSLQEGELGVAMLVACGERAIPHLRDYLVAGRPTTVPEPRQRAVRALAELGAKEALVEYLGKRPQIADAVVRFAEEAVENTAARAMGKWRTEDVFQTLLQIVSQRALPGALESLATFSRAETIPYFIDALGDDFAWRSAADALRNFGDNAVPALIEAARTPDPSGEYESPSSKSRRRRSVRILADSPLSANVWMRLHPLLWETDHEIAAAVARIALRIAPESDRSKAAARLIEALEYVDWLTINDIEDSLVEHYQELQSVVDAVLGKRCSALPAQERAQDPLINTLTRARRRALVSSTRS